MPRSYKKDSSNPNSEPQTPTESDDNKSRSYRQRPPINNTNSKPQSNKMSKEPSRTNSIQNLNSKNDSSNTSKNDSKQSSRNESRNSTFKSGSRRFSKNPSGNFEGDFISEVNYLRADPSLIKDDINNFEKDIKQSYSNKPNLLKNVNQLFSNIRNTKTNQIQRDEKLSLLANQYMEELKNSNSKKFYTKNQNELEKDLKMDFEEIKISHNYISTSNTPRKALFEMIFNEKDLPNSNGDDLINSKVHFIGICHEKIKDIPVTIVIVTDSNKLLKEKPLIEGLISEINKLRNNPLTYLKYISKKSNSYQSLCEARKVNSIKINDNLVRAAENRINDVDQKKNNLNNEELIKFLSQYGERFRHVKEYVSPKKKFAKEFVCDMIQKTNLDEILLNKEFNYIGFSESKKGNLVILFADNFDMKNTTTQISIPNLKRKVKRPNFTQDEIDQMKNDFNTFDITRTGKIKPNIILIFLEKEKEYCKENPFYLLALRKLNTHKNNLDGINVNDFIDAVSYVIREQNEEDFENNWAQVFNIYFDDSPKSKILNKEKLIEIINEMGFETTEDEINEMIDKMGEDIDEDKFVKIMKKIELMK